MTQAPRDCLFLRKQEITDLMEATLSKETLDKIDNLKEFVNKNGIIADEVTKRLLELRALFKEQNEPLITRVLRLTAEYIENEDRFDLNLLADEDEDGHIEEEIDLEGENSFNEMKENFIFLLDLCAHPDNQANKDELQRVKQLYLDRDYF